jgi:hypothetical protein
VNLANLLPCLLLAFTGLVLQLQYHMHHLPAEATVLGLQKDAWLLLHKVFAVMSLAGVAIHCLLHRKWIAAAARRRLQRKPAASRISWYLLLVSIPTALTGMASWLLTEAGGHGRFMLVEIHDKLALVLAMLFILHFVTRTGWMARTLAAMLRGTPTPTRG